MHNSIVHTENGFRGVPVAVAYRGKRSDQAITMFSGTSALSPFNTERRRPTLAAFQKKKQDSENIVLILTSTHHMPLAPSFYFQLILYPSQPLESTSCRPQSWWLFSIQSTILYALLKLMLCLRSVMLVWSFTATKISGTGHQPLLQAIRNMFVFVLVLPPNETICKMFCPTSDFHSTVILEYAMWSSAREQNSIWPGRWSH